MFPDPTPGLPYSVSLSICHLAGLAGSFCGFCSALSHKASELHVWTPPFPFLFHSQTCPRILMGEAFLLQSSLTLWPPCNLYLTLPTRLIYVPILKKHPACARGQKMVLEGPSLSHGIHEETPSEPYIHLSQPCKPCI